MENRYSFFLIAIVFFAMNVSLTFGEIFRDSLFLSSYPSHWLSYLFLSVVVLNIVIFSTLIPIIKKRDRRVNQAIVAILFFFGVVCAILLPFHFFWLPFIYALYFSLIFPTLTILCFNLASDTFSIREFKQISTKFRAIGTLAIILSAYTTPYLIAHLEIDYLLYFFLLGLGIIELILFLLPPPLNLINEKNFTAKKIGSYPLIRSVLPIVIFMSFGYYMSEYLMKNRLAEELNRDEIATFLGNFLGILNVLSLITQLFVSQTIINRYGVTSLFFIAPTIVMLGSIGIYFYPTLFALTVYTLAVFLIYCSFHLVAFEMTLSPLPLQVRLAAKTLEGGILEYLGQGGVALFFIALSYFVQSEEVKLLLVMLFSLSYCIPWYYLILQTQKFYRKALENAIRLRGFTLESNSEYRANLKDINKQDIAMDILTNPTSNLHSLGFSLIAEGSSITPYAADLMISKIDDHDELVQLNAIRCMRNKEQTFVIDSLINQLKKEDKSSVVWEIVKTISSSQNKLMLPLVEATFDDPISAKQVYLIPIALNCGDLTILMTATNILREAIEHEDEEIRLAATRVLGKISVGNPEKELALLIEDRSQKVVEEAINSCNYRHVVSLIPQIASHLGSNLVSHAASKALQSFGEASLDALMSIINQERKLDAVLAAVRTLAFLSGDEAEEAIIEIAHDKNALIKTSMSYWALLSARKIPRSSVYRRKVYQLIFKETKLRMLFKEAKQLPVPSYMQKELKIKLHMTSLRCLYWYGIYVDPEKTASLISPLREIDFSSTANQERLNSVLELLNSLTSDPKLLNLISQWETIPKAKSKNSIHYYKKLDPYLDKLIEYLEDGGEKMDDTLTKLIILREISLFERLPSDVLFIVATEAHWQPMSEGEVIYSEGDPPDGLYIITKGGVSAATKGKPLSHLKELDHFGEFDIINSSPRLSTIIATSDGLLLHIDQITFDDIINEFPDVLRAVTSKVIAYLQNQPD